MIFVFALYRVQIHIAGRATGVKDWQTQAVDEYRSRLKGTIDVDTTWYKTGAALEKALSRIDQPSICLDPSGRMCDSEGFALELFRALDNGSRLHFAIGPADGFSDDLRASKRCLSLSHLTFPHQLARVLLVEQIYRANEMRRGSDYHK